MAFDPSTSILAGMGTEQVQAALSTAQKAYNELMTGAKVVSASYAQGDGSKAVTYTQANIRDLTAYIKLLQAQLGIVTRPRRPISFNFR